MLISDNADLENEKRAVPQDFEEPPRPLGIIRR
jgi:hypothetical protein